MSGMLVLRKGGMQLRNFFFFLKALEDTNGDLGPVLISIYLKILTLQVLNLHSLKSTLSGR
jgi:hypothetical protein